MCSLVRVKWSSIGSYAIKLETGRDKLNHKGRKWRWKSGVRAFRSGQKRIWRVLLGGSHKMGEMKIWQWTMMIESVGTILLKLIKTAMMGRGATNAVHGTSVMRKVTVMWRR